MMSFKDYCKLKFTATELKEWRISLKEINLQQENLGKVLKNNITTYCNKFGNRLYLQSYNDDVVYYPMSLLVDTLHYDYSRVIFISSIEFHQDKIYVTQIFDKDKECIVNLEVCEESFLGTAESIMTYNSHLVQIILEQIEAKFIEQAEHL